MSKTPVWQRKAGKNPKGGLNEAGRRSLKAEGHDIKRPQPEGGSRRDSFCARMKGMKAKLTSSETANDPDSRINKSLRAWNCADGGAIRAELAGGGDALKAALKVAQAITSAKTSLNQVPGLFKSQLLEAAPGQRNLDIGGGRFDAGTEYLKSRGIESHVYDPFNRPAEHNEAVMSRFKENPADSVTVANVLNVIREPEARQAVIQQALDALRPGGRAYFSVYEGNRSGMGAETPKGWQENRKALEYLEEIRKHFPEAQRKGDIIFGSRPEMGAGGNALKAMAQNIIKAYHGSPHKFDKFDISKIGTGEGAQAYGHGLYFAENEGVARSYRDKLAMGEAKIGGRPVSEVASESYKLPYGQQPTVEHRIADIISSYGDNARPVMEARYPELLRAYNELKESGKIAEPGHMYEVGIRANPEQFLDWDRPLGEQPEHIQAIVDKMKEKSFLARRALEAKDATGRTIWEKSRNAFVTGAGVGNDAAASSMLRDAGIPGIRYLDQVSRGTGEGSRNYVVFDPSLIDIMRRYADGGRIPFDEGGLARVEDLIRQARGQQDVEAMSHPVGVSGNVEFAPVEIEEPLTQTKIPLGSLPASTAAAVNPIANLLAQYGPYAMGPIPAGIAAARDVGVGLREGSGFDVATAALGAPGKVAKYALPALGAATNMLAADPAEAGAISRAAKGMAGIALRRPDLMRVEHPYFPEGFRESLQGIVSPFSNDPEVAKAALEMARKLQTPLENKSNLVGSYFGTVQSTAPLDVTRSVMDIPGISLRPKTPEQSFEDLYKVGKGGTLINLAGDRSDFGRLTHIGGKELEFPVDLHAGPKYMREPNPGEVWANAPEHAGKLQKKVAEAEKKGPVIGLYTPMGAQSVSSSQHMFDALMAQVKGSGASKDDIKAFDDWIKQGKHFVGDEKNKKNAIKYMEDWPGLANAKEAAEFARKLPGHHRAAIVNEMEKAKWKNLGFPEVGVTRVAVTDPELIATPQNLIGGRASTLSTTNPRGADPLFQHSTYGSPTYGEYLMDLPFVQRQYAMPEAIKQYTQPTKTGTVVHPFSEQNLGRGSFRKLFETNFLAQPITQEWLDTLMTGLERQKQYGLKRGGTAN